MKLGLTRLPSSRLLERVIQSPDLVRSVQSLSPEHFSALIRRIGVEDSGELIALATTEQLTGAFDEDLFVAGEAGGRERFDAARFATWLEVLLEAGDAVAARRLSELSEDFVLHALLSAIVVLGDEALRDRMEVADDDAHLADKALESALSEQLDGYLLLGRGEPGWDAWISVILALDRDDRAFLERVLERAANACAGYLEDIDELCEALSSAESLAEDVEAEREERRAALGYVEPRAAAGFLALAARPLKEALVECSRDATTRAYFRDLASAQPSADRAAVVGQLPQGNASRADDLLLALADVAPESAPVARGPSHVASPVGREANVTTPVPVQEALSELAVARPEVFAERMGELAYLANVLVAGASSEVGRLAPTEAAAAALASVTLGALLELRKLEAEVDAEELRGVLEQFSADLLFRRAAGALVTAGLRPKPRPFLDSLAELSVVLPPLLLG